MAACLDVAAPYVRERGSNSVRPVGSFQLVQGKLADMYTTMNACRAYVYAVAYRMRSRRDDPQRRGGLHPLCG